MRFTLIIVLILHLATYGQRSDFENINFIKADDIAYNLKGENLKNLPQLTHRLTADLTTDVEKFRAIYTWVSTNIENDYNGYLKTRNKRKSLVKNKEALAKWNASFRTKVFKKLRNQKKTSCTGYAFLIREMAVLAGLNCKIINGYGRTATLSLKENSLPNHSWNAIALNKSWYLCDATWSSGLIVFEADEPKFKSEYADGYFLADPRLFIKNHFPLEKKWTLLSNTPSFNEFLEGPIVYKEAFSPNAIPITPIGMYLKIPKNETLKFRVSLADNKSKNTLNLLLIHNGSQKIIKPKTIPIADEAELHYTFEQTGHYDVHIRLKEAIIATYVVRVKRK